MLQFLISTVPLALIPAVYAWLVVRARRRGLGASFVGPFQEMWDPGAGRAAIEIEVQAEQAARAGSAASQGEDS